MKSLKWVNSIDDINFYVLASKISPWNIEDPDEVLDNEEKSCETIFYSYSAAIEYCVSLLESSEYVYACIYCDIYEDQKCVSSKILWEAGTEENKNKYLN